MRSISRRRSSRCTGAGGPLSVLELFHGPTAAFKDFGARFLAASLERIPREDPRRLTILVATSGDTGGAVAAAFFKRPWVDVVVLYPKGLVSPRQAQQLACWGHNVRTLAVAGSFDDCQRMVKEAFVDRDLARDLLLSSANSINVGRLLPQMAYYAQSSLELFRRDGRAAKLHRALGQPRQRRGLPLGARGRPADRRGGARDQREPDGERLPAHGRVAAAPQPRYACVRHGRRQPEQHGTTALAASRASSDLREQFSAYPVSDEEIRATIRRDHRELGQTWCPHTATAAHVYRQLPAAAAQERWVLVATAHPAKFNDVVEPLIGAEVPVPPALAELLSLPSFRARRGADASTHCAPS